jgi:hypothetical protein
VNPGYSGGPLLNAKGEVVGIVTLKKSNANNIGLALYLKEVRLPEDFAKEDVDKIKPEPGPLDPKKLPAPAAIQPKKENWTVVEGNVKESRGELVLDNNGGKYWLASKEKLPENYQIVIVCAVEFLQGRQRIQASQRSILRMLCVRLNTDETDKDIMERNGNLLQFSHELMHLWKDGKDLKTIQTGNPEDPFVLTITRQAGLITVAVDGEVVLEHKDSSPLQGSHRFCIGGYLSRLHLGEVSIIKLEQEKK